MQPTTWPHVRPAANNSFQKRNFEKRKRLGRADLEAVAGSEPSHVSYDQLEGYVGANVDEVDREILDSHVEVCPQCNPERDHLSRFADALNARRPGRVKSRDQGR